MRLLRRALDALYAASGALAALFLCAIFVTVLAQTGLNLADSISELLTGEPVGLLLPSYAEFAGFFLAAASFFALAHTLRSGQHIRVNLLLRHLPAAVRRWIEVWCSGIAALLAGYFSWYALLLARDSWDYGDVSYGLVAVPLWIPQSAMVAGLVVLTIALLDELQRALRGKRPHYDVDAGLLGGEPPDE